MLVNGAILDLIDLVKLALELDEFLSALRLDVDNALLVLLERVDDLHEVALLEEEFVVLHFTPVCAQ